MWGVSLTNISKNYLSGHFVRTFLVSPPLPFPFRIRLADPFPAISDKKGGRGEGVKKKSGQILLTATDEKKGFSSFLLVTFALK